MISLDIIWNVFHARLYKKSGFIYLYKNICVSVSVAILRSATSWGESIKSLESEEDQAEKRLLWQKGTWDVGKGMVLLKLISVVI